MSLIVALVYQKKIHAFADLRVVYSDYLPEGDKKKSSNYFNGVLKLIPINNSITIGFAGDISPALKCLRDLKRQSPIPTNIAEFIKNHQIDHKILDDCDFLIMDARDKSITKISNGEITKINDGRLWIGDVDAYNVFQQELSKTDYEKSNNHIAKAVSVMNSLDYVINDSSQKTVGEFPISIVPDKEELRLSVAFLSEQHSPTDSVTISLISPYNNGIAAIGLYIAEYKRGALYMPLEYDEPILIDADKLGTFRDIVLKDYGIDFLGGGFQ